MEKNEFSPSKKPNALDVLKAKIFFWTQSYHRIAVVSYDYAAQALGYIAGAAALVVCGLYPPHAISLNFLARPAVVSSLGLATIDCGFT